MLDPHGPTTSEEKNLYSNGQEQKSTITNYTFLSEFRTVLQQQMLDTNTNEKDEESVSSIHDT